MKHILLLGPPGAGKSTYSNVFIEKENMFFLSMGQLLRSLMNSTSPLAEKIKGYMGRGDLVPDKLIVDLVAETMEDIPDSTGYVFYDGFPRTIPQAEAFEKLLEKRENILDAVIYFEIEEEVTFERILLRAKIEGRADDTDERIVKNRIAIYKKETQPLLTYYKGKVPVHSFYAGKVDLEENKKVFIQLIEGL